MALSKTHGACFGRSPMSCEKPERLTGLGRPVVVGEGQMSENRWGDVG